ncbi:hypothetical protein NMG29_06690 [Streptomyces cocklensis]|uniref:Uncharacterized protein n=1 Tax=Actinacidiphila cocklensis TaxID=887465 RepID=A0A9W4DMP7_9ACTN|nr:hypothetical protein [Actinacidiphila cocklensis]MDD1057919.1 hypothetical protein [Actinacidiphila cocklensis]CAG6392785.1 hypothetical protein SCOCK_180162 [Actinacidiphila cocklensis]
MPTDKWGQGVSYLDRSDKPDLTLMGQNLADGLAGRSVMRFADTATRASIITAPVAGMVTWVGDAARLEWYTGSAWLPIGTDRETMPWTDLQSLGSWGPGFSAGVPAPRMQKTVEAGGTEVWKYEGHIAVASLTPGTGGIATAITFNTGYRPAVERGFMTYATSAGAYAAFTALKANGQLQVAVPTAAGSGTTSVSLDGVRITNPFAT